MNSPDRSSRLDFSRLVLPALFSVCAIAFVSPAWGQVYRCVDADEQITYTNVVINNKKNCKLLQVEMAPPAPAKATVRRPGAAANTTPASFPRVSVDAQKERDNNRRFILEQELDLEKQNLENAQRARDPSAVAQHERNIEALSREISGLRGSTMAVQP
ncbi:MAG: DUF4124 domain-containing protein [Zoogloeaceae bacterium]|nr:DUF4124 domain-containing protein [Zoogloeaceae bacterium]